MLGTESTELGEGLIIFEFALHYYLNPLVAEDSTGATVCTTQQNKIQSCYTSCNIPNIQSTIADMSGRGVMTSSAGQVVDISRYIRLLVFAPAHCWAMAELLSVVNLGPTIGGQGL